MSNISPTIIIREDNFHNAWAHAVKRIIFEGRDLTIGSSSEPKPIRDACVLFELTGNAIRQIEDHELHLQFPFRMVEEYCKEFTRDYLREYIDKPPEKQFSYLYFERLSMYPYIDHFYDENCTIKKVETNYIDQIYILRENLKDQVMSGISSNRHQVITWEPRWDIGSNFPPCLQRIWIRMIKTPTVMSKGTEYDQYDQKELGEVEVHFAWRSRDLFGAWQANLVALIDMLNREVIRPNHCSVVKIVDYCDSLHIYHSDLELAKKVRLVPVNPRCKINKRGNIK